MKIVSRSHRLQEPVVSVVVPARNAVDTVSRTLEGLSKQDLEHPFEVIVVDDGSTDRTAQAVTDSGLDVQLFTGDGSGAGRARNLGAGAATAPILAFTDADCEPQPGWLRCGLDSFETADLVQGAVRPDPAALMRPFDRTVRVSGETGLYETANLFIRRDLFERIGGFEDWLIAQRRGTMTRPLGEDLLLGWRARRSGARTTFNPDAVVHHAVFPCGPLGYLSEQLRLRYFPAIAYRVPETRTSVFFARFFLSKRTAAFDVAAGSAAAALLAGSPLPLVGILPYLWIAASEAVRTGPKWAPIVFLVRSVADVIGLLSLAWGSVRYRSPLL